MKHRREIVIAVVLMLALPAMSWALPSSPWMDGEDKDDATELWQYGQGAVVGAEDAATPTWSTGAAPAATHSSSEGAGVSAMSFAGGHGMVWPGHGQFCQRFPRFCQWRRRLPTQPTAPSVPEPGSMALLLVGGAVAAGLARRRAALGVKG